MLARVSAHSEQGRLYEDMLAEILSAYMESNIYVELQTDRYSENSEDLYWLSFAYNSTHFSIALSHKWKRVSGLLSILRWLESQNNQSNQFILRQPLQNLSETHKSEVLKFQCRAKNEDFNAWFRIECGFELPVFEKIIRNSWKIKIAVFIDLGITPLAGQVILSDPEIVFHLSEVIPEAEFNLSARLAATECEQILKLEEYDMNENTTLRTSIRLGAVEFKLEELLSLKSGSEVTFALTETTAVELELAGQVIAKGELRIAEHEFILGISEVFSS